ncbi:hypothetical protein [Treponema sp.]|uniref:hypothetical protein n=1 Tax=Treponema sp. TaxID=166 RepID=UPI00298D902B|nr:hypothetical protein [Treponema sp.]MCQ2241585.1 hypothetical protein [Treponema sp.]
MKKIIKTVILSSAILGSSLAFAYEFSAIVTDSTKLDYYNGKFENPLLKQSEKFIGAFTTPLMHDGVSTFAAEASVEHKMDKQFGDDPNTENKIVLDCTLFKFSTSKKLSRTESLDFSAGRYFYSDLSGIVIAQPNDGAFVKYSSSKVELSAYGGYTGLQNVKNVSILTSKGAVWAPEKEKDNYDFTAPYALGSLCVSFPYFFKNQTVSFEGLGAFNVGGPGDLKDDDKRIYGTVSLTGPLSNSLFYTVCGTFGTNDFDKIGLLGQLSLNYFSSFKNAMLGLSAVYASGEKDKVGSFVGFTKGTACLSKDEPVYSELFKAGVNCSFMPVDKLILSAGGDVVYKMPENSAEFYGFQVTGAAMYKMYSDLNLSLSVSQFTGKYKEASRTEIGLGLALAL